MDAISDLAYYVFAASWAEKFEMLEKNKEVL
jgi:hypothetical protein